MTEFNDLKRSYTLTIQLGLTLGMSYNETTSGNELLLKFCENIVENSCSSEVEKESMKAELKLMKESLSKEIDCYYRRG